MRTGRITGGVLLALLASCSGSTGPHGPTGVVSKITSVQSANGVQATVKSGALTGGQGGASVNVPSVLSVINGGTSAVSLTSTTSFYRVAVAIDGVDDYYELLIPGGTRSAQVLITLAQDLTETSLPLAFTAADENANYGATKHLPATVTKVGSGDVQISLSWDAPSDVDLHVIGPDNQEIYYGNRSSTSGGELDLDSNAACAIDNVNNENVTWPTGRSPAGTYRVLVDYWSSCGLAATNYVVTITVAGRAPQIFQGTFTGLGDRGGGGSGRLITTFAK